MLRNNPQITDLLYESGADILSRIKGITLDESRDVISKMSFKQYTGLLEAGANIVAPSGQSIGPGAAAASNANSQQPGAQQSQQQQAQQAPQKAQVMWAGQGSPVEQGMTVGLKGPNGSPVPGEVVSVDTGKQGVTIKNPVTGQQEMHGMDDLQPYVAGQPPNQSSQPQQPQQTVAEELSRLKQLAGISENCSAGATGAGSIAVAPAAMGSVKRRTMPENSIDEYTPTVAKTVIGDTKPKQDSGKLSARLAKAGKPSATRSNNGFKK